MPPEASRKNQFYNGVEMHYIHSKLRFDVIYVIHKEHCFVHI